MKKIAYLFVLIITITLAVNSCKKDGDLYFKYRPSDPNNMITQNGAELYTFSVKDTTLKVGSYHARVQGEITTYGNKIIQYGHCWGTSENPLLSVDTLMTKNEVADFDTSAVKSVTYESRLSNLVKETTYYVRSYIITADENGNVLDTGYNVNNLQITTLPPVNEWLEKTGEKRATRYDALAFNKGDTVYFGLGNQTIIGAVDPTLLKDFWQYDPVTETWLQLSSPYVKYQGLTQAVGFALTFYYTPTQKTVTRLYIGLGDYVGGYGDNEKTKLFNEYNIEKNEWNTLGPKGEYKGFAVTEAASFAIGDKAYVGTGYSNTWRNEWYMFDPVTYYDPNDIRDAWRQIDFPASSSMEGRTGAVAFSVNERGYFGLGIDSNGDFLNDFYGYNPYKGTWSEKADFPGTPRANAVGLKIDDQGYVGTGDNIIWSGGTNTNGGDAMSDFYRYDPFNDIWYSLADYTINTGNTIPKKVTRAVGFYSITPDELGYIGFGYIIEGTNHAQQDIWYYKPW